MDVADVVTALVNSRAIRADDPSAREDLSSPAALDAWWRRHVGTSWPGHAAQADLDAVLAVREGLRALLAPNNDAVAAGDDAAIAAFDAVAAGLPVRFAPAGQPALVPLSTGTPAAALAELLGRIAVLVADEPAWRRLKVCRDPACREAFRDTTRSRTRTWCSMELCGSRAKQRTFAARHRAAR